MPTAVPIDPGKLLEAARSFADHHGAQGRPRPVWLRRAVSSSYYALYHEISLQAVAHLLPRANEEHRLRLARSFAHREVKAVCQWVAGREKSPPGVRELVATLHNSPVDDVANTFIDLQERRHLADYDHLTPFPKQSVLLDVANAKDAIAKLTGASDQERETFFALLAFKSGVR